MKLRPHHLLCIPKYTGHGYSEDFTAHMNGLVAQLKAHPETPVTLVSGCDDLCGCCPNNEQGSCSSLAKVSGMDAAVLAIVQKHSGTWQELSRAAAPIFENQDFERICGNCSWFDLCKNTVTSQLPAKPGRK